MAVTTIGNSGTSLPLPTAPQGKAQVAATRPSAVSGPVSQQPSPEQMHQAIESMKQMVETQAPNSLAFSIDDSTGKTIVRISDAETGEMIRQIPSEELLDIARSLDKMQGLLLKQQA